MSVAELRNICEKRQIKRIAIIDDIFDIPALDRLDRTRYSEFLQRFNSNQVLKNAVTRVSGTKPNSLPDFDNLDEKELAPLWKCVWKQEVGGRKLNVGHAQALRALFEGHYDDVLGMLETVVELFSLFRKDLGRSVTVHGTGFDADEIAKAQIVVIDYFLGCNLTEDEALEKVSKLVIDVVEVARSANRMVPSFLLISSLPQQSIDTESFCKRAELMQSRFRFFSKEELRADRIKVMVSLHDLIDASNSTDIVERLIEDWRRGAYKAIRAVREQMLTLDVSDYVYLDCFRLTHEGTSIGNYLRWFLTASLNASVTGKLTKNLWLEADALKLFSVVDKGGHLDPKTLIKTFDGPSDAIAQAYGNILFDETRGTGDCAFPAKLPGHDLVEGDLFVRPIGKDRQGYEGAKIQLVITPSCDLLPRAPNQPPSAQSVLLLPGTLKRVAQEDRNSNFARDVVRVLERGQWCLLQIEWDFSQPISIDWPKICDEGPGKAFKRLGRVRDLYFHRVRDEFANHLTRIGTEVGPLFPRPRSGEVFIAVVKAKGRQFESVMSFSSRDRFVWEIGPVQLTRPNGRSVKKCVYQVSRQFLDKLADVLSHLPSEKPNLAESAKRSAKHLEDMQTYMELARPMPPGVRGKGGVVEFKEFKKDRNPSNAKQRSQADLQVVIFID